MTAKKKKDPIEQLINSIVEGILEVKGLDIVVLDLRSIPNASSDYFIICHGNSRTQAQAICKSVERQTIKDLNEQPWHIEGLNNSQWILLDFINVVVHVFEKEAREYYALEELWADAKYIDVEVLA
ncbi:MAG: ribosome silencing factor [Flavobacteriales bacterium]|nr:ribosome silencing factor [Flavobacteriales bacterium]